MTEGPSWTDEHLSSMARVALWLRDVVGEGHVFTKQALREALPNVEQVDRRMRDLRPRGWLIHNKRQDVRLASNELRLVTVGEPVWDRRTAGAGKPGVSAKVRRAVFARDGYLCVVCGISAGEAYADAPHQAATLTVVPRGEGDDRLVTECSRCRVGGTESARDVSAVRALLRRLDSGERGMLVGWASAGRRPPSAVDVAWVALRQLPAPDREAILESLRGELS